MGDCKDSNVSKEQNIRWVLPNVAAANETAQPIDEVPGAAPMHGTYTVKLHLPSDARSICTRENGPCTIQWLYMTGNSRDSYPEAFVIVPTSRFARRQGVNNCDADRRETDIRWTSTLAPF